MNIIIVDDEPIAQDILEKFCNKTPDMRVIAKCDNAIEALKVINEQRPDLIFLDIQMPELSGMELLNLIRNRNIQVIMTTAFSEHAVESYEYDVTDYLLKPIAYERFLKAVNKAFLQTDALQKPAIQNNGADDSYIFLRAANKLNKILIDDIACIESLKDYLKFIFVDKQYLIVHSTMKAIEEKLPADKFFRIHKSCLIAVKQIKAINGNNIELYNGLTTVMASARKEELYKVLNIPEG